MNGKGSKPRPYNPTKFGNGYDAINWNRPTKNARRLKSPDGKKMDDSKKISDYKSTCCKKT